MRGIGIEMIQWLQCIPPSGLDKLTAIVLLWVLLETMPFNLLWLCKFHAWFWLHTQAICSSLFCAKSLHFMALDKVSVFKMHLYNHPYMYIDVSPFVMLKWTQNIFGERTWEPQVHVHSRQNILFHLCTYSMLDSVGVVGCLGIHRKPRNRKIQFACQQRSFHSLGIHSPFSYVCSSTAAVKC